MGLYESLDGPNWGPGYLQWANASSDMCADLKGVECDNSRNVVKLDLGGNLNVHGTLPEQVLGALTALTVLELSHTRLEGNLPEAVGLLTNLEELDLCTTGLSGSIPVSIGNCKKLKRVDLSVTLLEGAIPNEFYDLPLLFELRLFSTGLAGSLSEAIQGLVNLNIADFSSTLLGGSLPHSIGTLQNLDILNLVLINNYTFS